MEYKISFILSEEEYKARQPFNEKDLIITEVYSINEMKDKILEKSSLIKNFLYKDDCFVFVLKVDNINNRDEILSLFPLFEYKFSKRFIHNKYVNNFILDGYEQII